MHRAGPRGLQLAAQTIGSGRNLRITRFLTHFKTDEQPVLKLGKALFGVVIDRQALARYRGCVDFRALMPSTKFHSYADLPSG